MKKLLILPLMLSLLASCLKVDVPKGTPGCLKKKIKDIEKKHKTNSGAEIWQYNYGGQTVYYIPVYECCDKESELIDDNCHKLCSPDGGVTGMGDGRCADFFAIRTDGRLVWRDTR